MEIIWSPQAKTSLDELIEFLESKWSVKTISTFLKEIEHVLSLISGQPNMYPIFSKKKKIHKCVVKRKTLLLYRTLPTHIELVKFVDGRQNPSKYKF
jgi:plasmid stabilization system protein ParE